MNKYIDVYVAACERYNTTIVAHEREIDQINKKISKLYKEIDQLKDLREEKRQAAPAIPDWIDYLVKPLVMELERVTGLKSYIAGPFGIFCHYTIYLHAQDADIEAGPDRLRLELMPPDIDGRPYYDTGKRIHRFEKGTLGEVNGGNKKFKY